MALTSINRQLIGTNPQELANKFSDFAAGFQAGSAVLVAGTVTVTGVTLTSTSVILLSRKTQGGTINTTVSYEAPSASRNTGASTFVINAVVAAGTVQNADTSTIDYIVIG